MASKLNNFVKFVMINANILLSFIGLFFFGFAFYLWFANWGDLDPGFFVGTGVIFALFGLSVTIIACIGCQGINNQTGKYGKPNN
jgi:amino acid transporter